MTAPFVDTADDLRLYLTGFDDGADCVWRTLADLVRAGVDRDTLKSVIEQANRPGRAYRQATT